MLLQRATNDIEALIDHVKAFINWWGDLCASLKHLKERLPMVKLDGSNPMQTSNVTDKWEKIKTECYRYQQEVLFDPLVI